MGLKLLKNRKGWMRIIEVVLASMLIFTYLTYIQETQFVETSQEPNWDKITLKTYGQDVLKALDLRDTPLAGGNFRSDLREIVVDENDWSGLGVNISEMLPENIGYTLYYYNVSIGEYENKTGAGAEEMPLTRDRVTVYYIISGDYGSWCESGLYPCALKLVLWFK